MRNTIVRLAVAIVALSATQIAPTAVAAEEKAPAMVCVSKAEFRTIEKGQSFAQVKRIIGGKPVASFPQRRFVERQWKECGMGGLSATVFFSKPGGTVLRKLWEVGCGGRETVGRC